MSYPAYSSSEAGPSNLRIAAASLAPPRQQSIPRPSSNFPRRPAYTPHLGCVLCSLVSAAHRAQANDGSRRSVDTQGSTASTPTGSYRTLSPVPEPPIDPSIFENGDFGSYPQPQPTSSPTSPTALVANGPGGSRVNANGNLVVEGREIIYSDEDITVYPAKGKESLCPDGKHLIIVLNRHLESVYDLGPSDIPTLSNIIDVSTHILNSAVVATNSSSNAEQGKLGRVRIGFVGSITRDPQSPYKHLHAHAMLGPMDTSLPGAGVWRRNVVFGGLNWWSMEDLRAEIREATSNNRIKSGYSAQRGPSAIDRVPDAGARAGLPNALDPDPYVDRSRPTSPAPESVGASTPTAGTPRGSHTLLVPPQGNPGKRRASIESSSDIGDDGDEYTAVSLRDRSDSREV